MQTSRIVTLAAFLSLVIITVLVYAQSEESVTSPPLSEDTEICIECHINYSPGIIEDWRNSRHARMTPEQAMNLPENQRRFSAESVPDELKSVAVGCYECHGLNPQDHTDNFEHAGVPINVIVSPGDCKICHPTEVDQFTGSKKAHALDNLRENPVFHSLVETTTGLREFNNDMMHRLPASDSTKQETCYSCHGTEVRVDWMKEVYTDVGEMKLPVFSNWPNQGVGRINPDGTRGACTACHPRHSFSIEIARKPHTCSQCHLEPDVPAWNVYNESKHGNIYNSKHDEWQWDQVPWELGKHFSAPTCSVCHNSMVVTSEGRTIAERTHDFGERLWVRIFGLIYSHPQPKSGKTYEIKNKDGLPLPVTFDGEFASEFLLDEEEQTKRQREMENICKSCHGSTWVTAHFGKMYKTIAETDLMIKTSTELMQKAWDAKLADNSNPFDESIEHKWMRQWLFYTNSIRYASAMTGAPDYTSFKNGWWNLNSNLQDMFASISEGTGNAETFPELVEKSTSISMPVEEGKLEGFASIDISQLNDEEKNYLGLEEGARPVLNKAKADIVILEFMNVYCPSCQMQAPIFNQLFSAIQNDSELVNRIKIIGVGVGNNQNEVDDFKEKRNVPYPIMPDPDFSTYKALANSIRTPYTVTLRRNINGNLVAVEAHVGLIRSYESYLGEIKRVLEYKDEIVQQEQDRIKSQDFVEYTEFKLTGKALYNKVKEVFVSITKDEGIIVEKESVPTQDENKVYQTISDNKRYYIVVANKESVCDICHAIQFIYAFDEKGKVIAFEPIHLTKYGNKVWSEEDVQKMRNNVIGRSILQPFDFDAKTDAVTSATITSAVIFQILSEGRDIYHFITK
ncbi:redoxin domain-containing protein [Candidatus Poribacteria bacterium]|nr:redoxin domain-containing protein [Candidatus Poribacteria bacterium]